MCAPDVVFDARCRINSGAFPDNPFDDRLSLFEQKALASLNVSVEEQANLVRSDL